MAQTPSTWADYVGDGVEDTFQVTFPYQKQSEVFVTVDGAPVAFTFISAGWVQLAAVPASGAAIRVQRSTEAFEPRHEFANGVPLLPRFIDDNNKQFLYVVQETVNETAGNAAMALSQANQAVATADAAAALIDGALQDSALYLRNDLANSVAPAKGAALVGFAGATVADALAARVTSAALSNAVDTNQGAALVGYRGRTVHARLGDTVSVKDFGATGDGVTDDTAAVQAALSYASSIGGGTVLIPWGMRIRILGNITIPTGCSLIGANTPPLGQIGSYNYLTLKQAVLLNSAATITLNGDSQVKRLCFLRDGMSWDLTRAQVDATFAGSCLTLADGQSDITVEECAFFGFDYAIRTATANLEINRLHLSHINMDCKNGILINNCYDVSYLREIHSWPWVSVSSPAETGGAQLKRSGIAFHLTGVNDWTDIQSCFDYGHYRGFQITDGSDVTLTNCKADCSFDAAGDGTIGFLINGQASGVRLVAPQAAGRQFGIWLDCLGTANADQDVTIIAPNVWVFKNTAIVVDRGRAVILGPNLRNGPTNTGAGAGIDCTTANGALATVIGGIVKNTALGLNGNIRHSGLVFMSVATPASNPRAASIAAADPLPVTGSESFYVVSGTASVGTIANAQAYSGKVLTLLFTGDVRLLHGGGMRLAGGVDFAAVAGSTISLVSDGGLFYEVGRKA